MSCNSVSYMVVMGEGMHKLSLYKLSLLSEWFTKKFTKIEQKFIESSQILGSS